MRRTLGLFFAYRFLGLTWVFVPFQVLFLHARGLSFRDVMLCNVVFCVAALILEIPTGMLADRYGRRLALVIGGIAMALGCVFFLEGRSVLAFAVANVLGATSMTCISGADSAYLFDQLRAAGREREYRGLEGWATAAKGIGNVLGFLVGGMLFERSPGWVFSGTAVASLAASAVAMALPRDRLGPGPSSGDVRRSFGAVRASRVLLGLIVYSALLFVPLRLGLFTDSPHLAEIDPTAGAFAVGALFAVKDLASALCAVLVVPVTRRLGERGLLVGLAAAVVGTTLWMGLAHGWWCLPLMVVQAGLFGLYSPAIRTALNASIDSSRDRATILSIEGMVRRAGFAALSPLFGAAVDGISLNTALLLSGLATLVGLVPVASLLRAGRRATAAASAEPKARATGGPALALPGRSAPASPHLAEL